MNTKFFGGISICGFTSDVATESIAFSTLELKGIILVKKAAGLVDVDVGTVFCLCICFGIEGDSLLCFNVLFFGAGDDDDGDDDEEGAC